MSAELPVDLVEQQEWLQPIEDATQKAVAGIFKSAGAAGRQVQNLLHGTWLGHPLHPVLTDIPLGAWTVTAVLDCMEGCGHPEFAAGADTSLMVGLVGAGGAALAGLTDWHVTDGRARRTGIMHGMLNTVAMALYAGSWIARRTGNRNAGRGLAFAGFVTSGAAAYLGGNLVFGKQIGVNHATTTLSDNWTKVMDERDLLEDKPHRADVKGQRLLLLRKEKKIFCISEVCSHLGGPLAEGEISDGTVTCPWHGSRFSLCDGAVIDGPATHPQPCFMTRLHRGNIEVKAREQE